MIVADSGKPPVFRVVEQHKRLFVTQNFRDTFQPYAQFTLLFEGAANSRNLAKHFVGCITFPHAVTIPFAFLTPRADGKYTRRLQMLPEKR